MKIWQEFRDFAMKGNMVDMAVGIVIGAAFGKVVTSLVERVITPLIGLLMGKIDFSSQAWALTANPNGPQLGWGAFVQSLIDFFIVAMALFVVVKGINAARKQLEKQQAAAEPTLTRDQQLLTEIRDALRQR
ncbi:MAG: large-conductance mechanosensitive channel protein MscL [Pirellulales bacterium]